MVRSLYKIMVLPFWGLIVFLALGCSEGLYKVGLSDTRSNLDLVEAGGLNAKSAAEGVAPDLVKSLESIKSTSLGKAPIGSQSIYTVYIRNQGGLAAQIKSYEMIPPESAVHFTPKVECSEVKGNFALCPVNFIYNPQSIGNITSQLVINYTDPSGLQGVLTLDLSSIADNRAFLGFDNRSPVDYSIVTQNFPDTYVGLSTSLTLKVIYNGAHIQNTGIEIQKPTGLTINTTDPSLVTVESHTCQVPITTDCTIQLKFTPKSPGKKKASISLSYFNGSETITTSAPVSGMGVVAPAPNPTPLLTPNPTPVATPPATLSFNTLSVGTLSFGNIIVSGSQPTPIPKSIVVNYTGGGIQALIQQLTSPTNSAFSINTSSSNANACSVSQPLTGNCTLYINYLPNLSHLNTAETGTMTVKYQSLGTNRPDLTLNLSGTAVQPAKLVFQSPLPTPVLNFVIPGNMPSSLLAPSTKKFIVKNIGQTTATAVTNLSFTDINGHFSSVKNCTNVAPNATCEFTVTADPKPVGSNEIDSHFTFQYNDGLGTQTFNTASTEYFDPAVHLAPYPLHLKILQPVILVTSQDAISTNISTGAITKTSADLDFGNIMIGWPQSRLDQQFKTFALKAYGIETLINANAVSVTPSAFNGSSAFKYYSSNSFPGNYNSSSPNFLCASPIQLNPNVALPANPNNTTSGIFNSCSVNLGIQSTNNLVANTPYTETIDFNYTGDNVLTSLPTAGANNHATITIKVTGRPAPVMTALPTIDFGKISLGDSRTSVTDKVVTFKNTSAYFTTSINLIGGVLVSGTAFSIQNDTCSNQTIAANGSCTVTLRIATNTAGTMNGTLTFKYKDQTETSPGVPREIVLSTSLTGTITNDVTVIHPSVAVNFGDYFIGNPTPTPIPVSMTYYGGTPSWTLTPNIGSGGSNLSVDTSQCGSPAGFSGSTCKAYIHYIPSGVETLSNVQVKFVYNPTFSNSNASITSGTFTINVSGATKNKFATLGIALAPSTTNNFTILFNDNAVTAGTNIYRISNTGNGPASVLNKIFLPSGGPFTLVTGSVPSGQPCVLDGGLSANLAAGDYCDLKIIYQPSTSGSTNGSLKVTYSDPSGSYTPTNPQLTFTGNASYASSQISLSLTPFGKVIKDQYADQIVTISNAPTASAAATLVGAPNITGPFSIQADGTLSPACEFVSGTYKIQPGAQCKFKLRFAPQQINTQNGSISIYFKDPSTLNSTTTLSTALTGIGTQVIQIFAGANQTCMINELNKAICWGSNNYGQLGVGSTSALSQLPQQQISTPLFFGNNTTLLRKLAVGNWHTCVLANTNTTTGVVSCWGSNEEGRLGKANGTSGVVLQPEVSGNNLVTINFGTDAQTGQPLTAKDISAGFEHTCAILSNDKVKCWGANTSGQLGVDHNNSLGLASNSMGNNLPYAKINTSSAVVSISAGAGHTCASFADGNAQCWGDNHYGQLGQKKDVDSMGAGITDLGTQMVHTMSNINNISLGTNVKAASIYTSQGAHTCFLSQSGNVKCFGKTVDSDDPNDERYNGILGTCWARNSYNSSAVPCWTNPLLTQSMKYGYYSTDMGDNLPAVDFKNSTGDVLTVNQLALGNKFSCALLQDNSVRCWGINTHGALGNNGFNNVGMQNTDMGANLAASLASFTDNGKVVSPKLIAAGEDHACVVFSNNTVKCWGNSLNNAIGSNGAVDINNPSTAPVIYDGR